MTQNKHTDSSASKKFTETIQVDSRFVGLIIGTGGATCKKIAKDAGSGCRINHIRERPGTFEI